MSRRARPGISPNLRFVVDEDLGEQPIVCDRARPHPPAHPSDTATLIPAAPPRPGMGMKTRP